MNPYVPEIQSLADLVPEGSAQKTIERQTQAIERSVFAVKVFDRKILRQILEPFAEAKVQRLFREVQETSCRSVLDDASYKEHTEKEALCS